jgi:hypothetical protein
MRIFCLPFALLLSLPLPAQKRMAVSSKIECPKCTIELTKVMTIALPDTIPVPSTNPAVRDAAGRLYLFNGRLVIIQVFGPDGKLLRSMGRKGKGPGEFETVRSFALGPGDSLYAFDSNLRRVSIFSPNGTFVRSFETQAAFGRIFFGADGQLIGLNNFGKEDCYQILSPTGTVTRGFSQCGMTGYVMETLVSVYYRSLAPAGNGNFWAGRQNHYEIERWSYAGEHLATIVREADWFQPWDPEVMKMPDYTARPLPKLYHVVTLKSGVMLTGVARASAVWEPPKRDAQGNWVRPAKTARPGIVTFVEAIDPETGKLLAVRELPFIMRELFADGYFVQQREDDDGVPFVELWQLTLKGR